VIIGIDSMVLIYAEIVPSKIAKRCVSFDDLRDRSKLLLHRAATKKNAILLPTVAISELLVPVPRGQQGALIALLQRMFVCPPFSLPAASIAADLLARHKGLPRNQQYDQRHIVRADAMIIASAQAAGATDFYSHDKKCRTLAGLVMTAHDLPTQDPENPMFWRQAISDTNPAS
jgi:hypothetical protein